MSKTPRPFRLDVAVSMALQMACPALFHTLPAIWLVAAIGLLLTVTRWQLYHAARTPVAVLVVLRMQMSSWASGFTLAVASACWSPSSEHLMLFSGTGAAVGLLTFFWSVQSVSRRVNQVWTPYQDAVA